MTLGTEDDFGWVSFSGKSTYVEPGWLELIGNHEFLVYFEDWRAPGAGGDRFWIEIHDKDGNVIAPLSLEQDATNNAALLEGGNKVVPH